MLYRRGSSVSLPLIDPAAGIYMLDEDGNEYIDASSGPMVSALGHRLRRRPMIIPVIVEM